MIRKALSLLLSLCMLAVLAGCGGDVQPESSPPAPDAAALPETQQTRPEPKQEEVPTRYVDYADVAASADAAAGTDASAEDAEEEKN